MSYTKLNLRKIVPKDDIPDKVLACEINLSKWDKLWFCVSYRSSNSSEYNSKKINELMRKLISLNHSHVPMVGDYNYPKIDWTSYTNEWKHEDINFEFIECVRDDYMYQHVTTSTSGRGAESHSVLDLVFFKWGRDGRICHQKCSIRCLWPFCAGDWLTMRDTSKGQL